MAGKITELRYQKRNPDRVNVYLDGEFAFGLPDVEAARLRLGQYLSDVDIERLQGRDAEQRAYDRALHFLGYRPRSEAEVRQNLARAGTDEALIERVISRLQEHDYLNDVEFARFWIEDRERFRPRGARALREELRRKGVADGASADILAGMDQEASAYRVGQARAARLEAQLREDRSSFRRRLGDFLARRGFDYEVVRRVVARLESELLEDELSDDAE
jgi:regulatory protein